MKHKTFDITQVQQLSLFNLKKNIDNNCKYLFVELIGNNFYFLKIPIYVKIIKTKDFLQFVNIGGHKYQNFFKQFLNLFDKINLNNNERFKISLTLKGGGYTATISKCNNFLNLNVGLSHKVEILLPSKKIDVTCEKDTITIQGTDKKFVGDFVSKIRNIKKPDAYKGKGF